MCFLKQFFSHLQVTTHARTCIVFIGLVTLLRVKLFFDPMLFSCHHIILHDQVELTYVAPNVHLSNPSALTEKQIDWRLMWLNLQASDLTTMAKSYIISNSEDLLWLYTANHSRYKQQSCDKLQVSKVIAQHGLFYFASSMIYWTVLITLFIKQADKISYQSMLSITQHELIFVGAHITLPLTGGRAYLYHRVRILCVYIFIILSGSKTISLSLWPFGPSHSPNDIILVTANIMIYLYQVISLVRWL